MSEHGIAASSALPPLSARLAGILPIDKSPRALVGEVPSGASALLSFALARRHGTAMVVLPTPHHLDAFLADAATLSAVESSEVAALPFRLLEAASEDDEDAAVLGARLDAAKALATRKTEIPNPGENPKSRNPETPSGTGISEFRNSGVSRPILVATSVQALMQAAPAASYSRAMER